jgi:hypothetical protein
MALSLLGAVALLSGSLPSAARATTIRYQATDLTDVVAGEDRWKYRYQVSDFAYPAGYGFDIFFRKVDGFRFGDLENPPPAPNGDWDVITIQPDPLLPDDGRYDAVALVDNPSLADFFTVQFVWRGAGKPGSQKFEVFDGGFAVLQTGQTIPLDQTVPEPGTLGLAAVGAGGLLTGWGRRRSRTGRA